MRRRSVSERLRGRLLRLLGVKGENLSFSQLGEDRIVYHLASVLGVLPPRYVDVGANLPDYANNTYLFYRLGARGICIDPNPQFQKAYRKVRPDDTLLNVAVAPGGQESTTMFKFSNPSLNTLDPVVASKYASFGYEIVGKRNVQTTTLTRVFEQFGADDVQFLSIDAEGADLQVLQTLDFKRFRPWIVCAETVGYRDDRSEYRDNSIDQFLLANDYLHYADTHVNSIYVLQAPYCVRPKI